MLLSELLVAAPELDVDAILAAHPEVEPDAIWHVGDPHGHRLRASNGFGLAHGPGVGSW